VVRLTFPGSCSCASWTSAARPRMRVPVHELAERAQKFSGCFITGICTYANNAGRMSGPHPVILWPCCLNQRWRTTSQRGLYTMKCPFCWSVAESACLPWRRPAPTSAGRSQKANWRATTLCVRCTTPRRFRRRTGAEWPSGASAAVPEGKGAWRTDRGAGAEVSERYSTTSLICTMLGTSV